MKRIFSFILAIILSVTGLSWAAVGNGTVWEYRTTATNTNLNGGGYDSTVAGAGTDYSQQNAAQVTFNNITCVQNSVTINSVSGTFTAAMVGNVMQFTNAGSFTDGFYTVQEYVSTRSVKLKTTPYTGAGTGSGGTAALGGALYLPTDTILEFMVSGNIAWVKSGTYTLTGAISISTGIGATTRKIMMIGYNSTRGDNPTGTNRPYIVCGSNQLVFGSHIQVMNMRFTSSRAYSPTFSAPNPSVCLNCFFENTSSNSSSSAAQGNVGGFIDCEFICRSGRATVSSSGTLYQQCYIRDSNIGILSASTNWARVINTVIASCNIGFQQSAASGGSSQISGSIIYNCPTGIDSSGGFLRDTNIFNNIFHTGTNAILDTVTNISNIYKYNLFYNYTNTLYLGLGTLDSTNITGQDPLFTNVLNRNFTLQQGSPAINAGYPMSGVGLNGTYKNNIGVDQTQTSTSGTKSWAY